MTYGIEFPEFIKGIPVMLPNLLLLRHKFDDGNFNMHTMLEFADEDGIKKLVQDDVYGYGDFCWIDFEDEESLNELSGQEMAELLYLGHYKDHLRPPFYRKLGNNFSYLAHDDGWFNKTYYRSLDHFYSMLGHVISEKLGYKKEKSLLGRWKKKEFPAVPAEVLFPFIRYMKEGIVFSIEKAERNRLQIEIPVWIMGDFYDMDAMYEEYEMLEDRVPDGRIVLDRKTGEWQAYAKGVKA